ncbi:MAG: GNAT family N-acetyltransferase [Candidatus Eremiobacteraeota bacterium]|nr:GNAT family N-acetyltransferase [Candidatus Eremiobacteraeota bacterium]
MAFIETERLILRTWMPSDASALLESSLDREVTRFLPVTRPPTLESSLAWIDRQMDEQEREGFSVWPVIRKEDGRLIGRCGLHRLPEGYVEVVWVFERDAWGHGFATEAARAAAAYAREPLRLPALYALINPANSASIAVAYRLGMRFDRVVRAYKRDLLRYVL